MDRETRIETPCPSCGSRTLFIGEGGHLTCSLIGCKEPGVERAIAALRAAPPAQEVYPNSDKGLAQMFPGVSVPMLRGIQEAAFRAGRESMAARPETAAPTPAPTREQWQAAVDYIELLESSQDGYYRASETDEANRWRTIAAALSSPVGETPARVCAGCAGRGVVGGYEPVEFGNTLSAHPVDVPCPDCGGSGETPEGK